MVITLDYSMEIEKFALNLFQIFLEGSEKPLKGLLEKSAYDNNCESL
jgi:hypothetical protein